MEEGSRRDADDEAAAAEADKGAGGKLSSRPFHRRTTPYDRPPLAAKSKNGWFSKLVVKSASKILHLPSLFPSASSSTKNQDRGQDRDQLQSRSEVEQEGATVCTLISDNQVFEPKESPRYPKVDSEDDDSGIAEIEQQLQEKNFSRDETNHLLELLRSRTTDLPDKDGQAAGLNASEVLPSQKVIRRSTKAFGVQFDSQMTPKTSNNSKFTVQDGGSSPIEIAKAYMEGRPSTSSYGCQTGRSKNEGNLYHSDRSASKLSFTPAIKSPLCWPGAVVQSDHGYSTQRESIMSRPQTPYSGGLFSKSTSKFSVNAERANHSSTERSAHVLGHNMMTSTRMKSKTENAFVSVSPAHHIFQKNIASTSRGAGPSNLATSFSLPSQSSDISSSLSSSFERKLEHGSSKVGYSVDSTPVHPQSSELARKILEHVDRTVPSPKEKLLEIALARKRVPPKAETPSVDDQHDKCDVSISDEKQSGSLLGRDVGSQEIADSQKVLSGQPSGASNDKVQLSSCPQYKLGLFQNSTAINSTSQISNHLSHSSQPTAIPVANSSENLRSSDNGFNVGFPIPATSAAISVPPFAPIITPQSITSTKMETEEGIPAAKFGFSDSEACNRLVFSFGSTASSSNTDIPTPDFKFGTGKKRDLSFEQIGVNGIC